MPIAVGPSHQPRQLLRGPQSSGHLPAAGHRKHEWSGRANGRSLRPAVDGSHVAHCGERSPVVVLISSLAHAYGRCMKHFGGTCQPLVILVVAAALATTLAACEDAATPPVAPSVAPAWPAFTAACGATVTAENQTLDLSDVESLTACTAELPFQNGSSVTIPVGDARFAPLADYLFKDPATPRSTSSGVCDGLGFTPIEIYATTTRGAFRVVIPEDTCKYLVARKLNELSGPKTPIPSPTIR